MFHVPNRPRRLWAKARRLVTVSGHGHDSLKDVGTGPVGQQDLRGPNGPRRV